MTYPFIYFGAGGAEQCGGVTPSNYLANAAYAGDLVSTTGDASVRATMFYKRQSDGNKEKFTIFATFRRSTLGRDSVTDKISAIMAPEGLADISSVCNLLFLSNDKISFRNAWDDGTTVIWITKNRFVDVDGFYNIIVSVNGKNSCRIWSNGKELTLDRTVHNIPVPDLVNVSRWNDSRYDLSVGGCINLKKPNGEASPSNPEWPFRAEMVIAGLLDGVVMENPNSLGFFDEKTQEWVPTIPNMVSEVGNSFLLVGRDKVVKDAYRHYMIGGKPAELNAVSPNKDPIGMAIQASYENVPDFPDIMSPLLGDNRLLSPGGYLRTTKHTFSADGRLLSQPDPFGVDAGGNPNSGTHPDGHIATLVFPNSPDKGMSYVKYVGDNTKQLVVPHNLGRKPEMVMIYRAKSGGAAAGTQFPHIWVKDQTGCTSVISDTGGGYVDNADNKAGQFLQAKMDDTNIYIDKWLDPASQPSSFVGTTSTKGRHHDSVIFTVGAVTYMLVCEWEQADNANAAVTTLFQIATDGTVTSLESKSHPRITAMEYFTLGGEHYVLLNQRATAPATNSVAGRLIIYQINTATKKFGTSWTSPADKDFLKADLFIDGSKAVLTLGTDNKSATAAHKDAVCYDFDEASGFHNARNVAILNQNPVFKSFLVGTERYGVTVANDLPSSSYWDSASSQGVSVFKFTKWQTGSRTWSAFIPDMEFGSPKVAQNIDVLNHNGRIYLAVPANICRFEMFNAAAERGVYLYEFEIAKMRIKALDVIYQSGASFGYFFTKGGKAYLGVAGRSAYSGTDTGDQVAFPSSMVYRISDDGNSLIVNQRLGSGDHISFKTGEHSNGKLFGCLAQIGAGLISDVKSTMFWWDDDLGGFKSHAFSSNMLNQTGVEYLVAAYYNSDSVTIDRVGSSAWRTFIPGMTHTWVDDGERYFAIHTQVGNLGSTITAAEINKHARMIVYQYCKYRGTLIPIQEEQVMTDSRAQVYEHGGDFWMATTGYRKLDFTGLTADAVIQIWKWNKKTRKFDKHQALTGTGAPAKPVVFNGALYLTFFNTAHNTGSGWYPALWKWNETSKVFENLTAAVTTQAHIFYTGSMFVKNGKLWFVGLGKWMASSATVSAVCLFEVNSATGVFNLVQNASFNTTVDFWGYTHEVAGHTMLAYGADNANIQTKFGLFRFNTATERFEDFYAAYTVDNTANPVVNYIEYNGRHLFFYPAYTGTVTGLDNCGATTIIEYDAATDKAYAANTFYTQGMIQIVPFQEDGALKAATMFYYDPPHRGTPVTNADTYAYCHSNIAKFNDKTNTFTGAWQNNNNFADTDFTMWISNKEGQKHYGPDYYYDITGSQVRQRYLFNGIPLSGSTGNATKEGGVTSALYAPKIQERGTGFFISSDKWMGGFELDERTGNPFASKMIHGGGVLATHGSHLNKVPKFNDNIKQPGKEKANIVVSVGGSVAQVSSGQTGFFATPHIIPGYGSKQTKNLIVEFTLTIVPASHFAFGFTTFEDKDFSNAAIRAVAPKAGATGIISNTTDFASGDIATFVFNYVDRTITLFNNGVKDVSKAMPSGYMCAFVDGYEAVTTSSSILTWVNMGRSRFEFPQPDAFAPRADILKESYTVVNGKSFFDEGITGFTSATVSKEVALNTVAVNYATSTANPTTVPVSNDVIAQENGKFKNTITFNNAINSDDFDIYNYNMSNTSIKTLIGRRRGGSITSLDNNLTFELFGTGSGATLTTKGYSANSYRTEVYKPGVFNHWRASFDFKKYSTIGTTNTVGYDVFIKHNANSVATKVKVGTVLNDVFTASAFATGEGYYFSTDATKLYIDTPIVNGALATNATPTAPTATAEFEKTSSTAQVGDALAIKTKFSPDLVMVFDEAFTRKHRWFYRGWGDNNYYSGQDFNGALQTTANGGIDGFNWRDDGFDIRKNADASWGSNDKVHYMAWNASKCSGIELIEYTGSASPVVLNLNNIEGTPDAVIIFSKDDASNRPSVFSKDFDSPGRNYFQLHTASGIQTSATTLITFEDKKLTIVNANGYNQAGKTYLAFVMKSVPGFSFYGVGKATGEIDGMNYFVGISPSASMTCTLGTGHTFVTKQLADNQSNPGTHWSTTTNAKDADSKMEFHSTGIKVHEANTSGTKGYCMMWGSPWVYANAR